MSSNNTIQHVVTGGVQAIAAILPLLGTEQCEQHIGSGLIRGYLYVIATPISIFGSLGIAKAGFNILVASIAFQRGHFLGAKMLTNGGFKPAGDSSPMIAFDEANPDRFLAESKFLKMLKDENIENVEDLSVEWGKETMTWNLRMMALSFVSVLGFTPYIYFVTSQSASSLLIHGWPFPATRLLGSTISALTEQFIIQIRILQIVKSRLIFILVDRYVRSDPQLSEMSEVVFKEDIWSEKKSSEICLWNLGKKLSEHIKRRAKDEDIEFNSQSLQDLEDYLKKQYKRHFPRNTMQERLCGTGMLSKILLFSLQLILFFAMVFSILGYIGSFYVIQNAPSGSIGPLLWLGLEVVLCLIRIVIWAYNPHWDDAKGMEFKLDLVKKLPLPTCDLYGEEFEKYGSAPFVRAKEFLNETAAFAGPIHSFIWDDASLYFMFTKSTISQAPDQHNSQRTLYLVCVHDKEQTSRLLVKSGNDSSFSLYYCSVKFHPKRPVVEIQTNFGSDGTFKETHVFTSNGEFMKNISEYYDQIVQRYTYMEDFVYFPKLWSLNAVTAAKGAKSNHELDEEPLQFPEQALKQLVTMNPWSTDSVYINIGVLKRRCFHLIDQFTLWFELYLDLLLTHNLELEETSLKARVESLLSFEAAAVHYLKRTFSIWKATILDRHENMSDFVVSVETGPQSTSSVKKLQKKMINRLADERLLYIEQFEQIVGEKIDKLKAKFKVVLDNLALDKNYELRGSNMGSWIVSPIDAAMERQDPTPIANIKEDRYKSQLEEISKAKNLSILESTSALAKFWEMDALEERIHFLNRKNKFVRINEITYNIFGSLDCLISALKAAGTITVVAFGAAFTTEEIVKIVTEVTSITSVVDSWFNVQTFKSALKKNRRRVSYFKPMTYYENVEVESNSELSDHLFLVFRSIEFIRISDYEKGWQSLEDENNFSTEDLLSHLPYYCSSAINSLGNENNGSSGNIPHAACTNESKSMEDILCHLPYYCSSDINNLESENNAASIPDTVGSYSSESIAVVNVSENESNAASASILDNAAYRSISMGNSSENDNSSPSASTDTVHYEYPGTSVAVVKFEIKNKIDHTLTLEHCFENGEGYIVITLNNDRLVVKVTTTTKLFRKQEFILPQTILKGPGQLNTLKLNAHSGGYANIATRNHETTPPPSPFQNRNYYCLSDMHIRPTTADSND